MVAAWSILQQTRNLICCGCSSHEMSLLMKDIFEVEDCSLALKKATTLAKFVKSCSALKDRFGELQKQMKKEGEQRRALSFPVLTRWYPSERCIRSVVSNQDVIAAAFLDSTLMSRYQNSISTFDDVTSILRDESFWRLADHVLKLVGPVDQSLAAFERDICCISLVYQQFEWMQTHSAYTLTASRQDATLQRCVLDKINERRGFVCDETMSDEERSKHIQFSPLDWWSLSNRFPAVKEFASRILAVPTSSASSERN